MSNKFTREARYVVLKSADAMKCLTVSEIIELRRIQAKVEEHRAEIGKPPLDCVVVESDWPEYEPTWRAIEARVTDTQAQPTLRVPPDAIDAINRARETAMKHTLVARIPECGVFAEIAQDLDYVQSKLVPEAKP